MAKKTPLDYTISALIFLVLFFGAAALSSQIIFRSELVTLPNLAGKTPEEARAILAEKRTGLAVQGTRFDSRIEKGRILSQDPGPGSRIKTKRTVSRRPQRGERTADRPRPRRPEPRVRRPSISRPRASAAAASPRSTRPAMRPAGSSPSGPPRAWPPDGARPSISSSARAPGNRSTSCPT